MMHAPSSSTVPGLCQLHTHTFIVHCDNTQQQQTGTDLVQTPYCWPSNCRLRDTPWWQSDDSAAACSPAGRCAAVIVIGMWLLTAKDAERGSPVGCGIVVAQWLPAIDGHDQCSETGQMRHMHQNIRAVLFHTHQGAGRKRSQQ